MVGIPEKLTKVTAYKNTPFINARNTLHFESNEDRDDYFDTFWIDYDKETWDSDFNLSLDRGYLILPMSIDTAWQFNYCKLENGLMNNTYYCYLTEPVYINDNAVKFNLTIDPMMTWTQGNVLWNDIYWTSIERQHVNSISLKHYEQIVTNNADIINLNTKRIYGVDHFDFQLYTVFFTSSVDLFSDFGVESAPKLKGSTPYTYDKITSPLTLGKMSAADFRSMMNYLKDFPWISQNITGCYLVPNAFISNDGWQDAPLIQGSADFHMMVPADGSSISANGEVFSYEWKDLIKKYGLTKLHPYFFRSDYFDMVCKTWTGKQFIIEPENMPTNNLKIMYETLLGYENKVAIYPQYYKQDPLYSGDIPDQRLASAYIDGGLVLDTWDTIPVQVDQYKLKWAEQAYSREYEQSNLQSAKVARGFDSSSQAISDLANGNISGAIDSGITASSAFNGTGIGSGASAIAALAKGNIAGGFKNALTMGKSMLTGAQQENEYYRKLGYQQKQAALTPPTTTTATRTNSFAVANESQGIWLQFEKVDDPTLDIVKKYHCLMGFKTDNQELLSFDRPIANYVQGSCIVRPQKLGIGLGLIKQEYLDYIQKAIEMGIRFFKYTKPAFDPDTYIQDRDFFSQDITKNLDDQEE